MKEAVRQFTLQSLVVTLVLNGLLLVAIDLSSGEAPVNRPTLYGTGAALSLVLWGVLQAVARRLFARATASHKAVPKTKEKPAPATSPSAPAATPSHSARPESGAVQMLSILQRKGRLIDFLQEDIRAYQDAQIGAAVRNVHEGCREALAEYATLEPIFPDSEGSKVSVRDGFDANSIRLVGNVTGRPPFQGTLRHRGWRVARIKLPERVGPSSDDTVIAAAEVEVGS